MAKSNRQIPKLTRDQRARWKVYLDDCRSESVGTQDSRLTATVILELAKRGEFNRDDRADADSPAARRNKKRRTLVKEYSEFKNAVPTRVRAWFGRTDSLNGVIEDYAAALGVDVDHLELAYRRIALNEEPGGDPAWHRAFPEVPRSAVVVEPPVRIDPERGLWQTDASVVERLETVVRDALRKVKEGPRPDGAMPVVVSVVGPKGAGRRTLARRLIERLNAGPDDATGLQVELLSDLADRDPAADVSVFIPPSSEFQRRAEEQVTVSVERWEAAQLVEVASTLKELDALGRIATRLAELEQVLKGPVGLSLPPLPADLAISVLGALAHSEGDLSPSQVRDALVTALTGDDRHLANSLGAAWTKTLKTATSTTDWELPAEESEVSVARLRAALEETVGLVEEIAEFSKSKDALAKIKDKLPALEKAVRSESHEHMILRAREYGAVSGTDRMVPVEPMLARILVARHAEKVDEWPFADDDLDWWSRDDSDLLAAELAIAGYSPRSFFQRTDRMPTFAFAERAGLELVFASNCADLGGQAPRLRQCWAELLLLIHDVGRYVMRRSDSESGAVRFFLPSHGWADPFVGTRSGFGTNVMESLRRAAWTHASHVPVLRSDRGTFESQLVLECRPELRDRSGRWVERLAERCGRAWGSDFAYPMPDWWGVTRVMGARDEADVLPRILVMLSPLQVIDAVSDGFLINRMMTNTPELWDYVSARADAGDEAYRARLENAARVGSQDSWAGVQLPWPLQLKWWRPVEPKDSDIDWVGFPFEQLAQVVGRAGRSRTKCVSDERSDEPTRDRIDDIVSLARRLNVREQLRFIWHLAAPHTGPHPERWNVSEQDSVQQAEALDLATRLERWEFHRGIVRVTTKMINSMRIRVQPEWPLRVETDVHDRISDEPLTLRHFDAVKRIAGLVKVAVDAGLALAEAGYLDELRVLSESLSVFTREPYGERVQYPPDHESGDVVGMKLRDPARELMDRIRKALLPCAERARFGLWELDDDALLNATAETPQLGDPARSSDASRFVCSERGVDRVWALRERMPMAAIDLAMWVETTKSEDTERWLPYASVNALRRLCGSRHASRLRAKVVPQLLARTSGIEQTAWRLLYVWMNPAEPTHDVWLRDELADLDAIIGDGILVDTNSSQLDFEYRPSQKWRWKDQGVFTHLCVLPRLVDARPEEWVDVAMDWLEVLARTVDAGEITGLHDEDGQMMPVHWDEVVWEQRRPSGSLPEALIEALARTGWAGNVWERFGFSESSLFDASYFPALRSRLVTVWAKRLRVDDLAHLAVAARKRQDADVLFALANRAELADHELCRRILEGALDDVGDTPTLADLQNENTVGWILFAFHEHPVALQEYLHVWATAGLEQRDHLCRIVTEGLRYYAGDDRGMFLRFLRRWSLQE